MALDSVAQRLEDLAETDSPLQRSRAMAQLWSDIRLAPPEDRRRFAHALADRFAPAIAERFETVAGIEGPEFIKLVRDLIDIEADDIRAVIADLGETVPGEAPSGPAPVSRGDVGEAAGTAGTEQGQDDEIDRLFDRITEEVEDVTGRPDVDEALLTDDVEASSLAKAVEALDQLPDSERRPSAFDVARERLSRFEDDDTRVGDTEPSAEDEPPEVARPPAVVWEPPVLDEPRGGATSRLEERLAATPDGWRRRRLLSAAIRRDEVDTATALELSEMLSSRIDRGWIAGDLIERGVDPAELHLFHGRGLPPHLLRRLDRSR